MAETTPNYGNADSYSAEASATIKARNCLEVSGARTVAPTAGPGGAFAGVAAYDVPKGELVTVRTTGVHTLRCTGDIAAGARVTTAPGGAVTVGEPAIGIAQSPSVGGACRVKLIAPGGGGSGGASWADVHAAAEKATPVDGDDFALMDSAATWGLKRITFGALKARLLDYVSTAAATFSNKTLTSPTVNTPRITGGTYDNVTGAMQGGTTSESIGTPGRVAVMSHVSAGATASVAVLPDLHNALAYHILRGGTVSVTVNGVDKTSSVALENAFQPNSMPAEIATQATTDVVVIEADLTAYRDGDPAVGVLAQPIIGAQGRWHSFARSVTLEVHDGSAWTQAATASNVNGQFAAWAGAMKFPGRIRWTFTNMASASVLRINSLYAISVADGDAGFSGFLPRGGGRLYGSTAKPPAVTASGKDSAIPLVIGGKNADVTTPDGAIFTTLVPMPASGTAAGRRGMIAFAADGSSAAVCVTSGAAGAAVWKRITLAAF